MRRAHGAWRMAAIVAAVALGLAACGGAAPDTGRGLGVVEDVDPASREVTLDHGDIPGLMKAMTMTFAVAESVDLVGVEPGARVAFEVRMEGGRYTVTSLRPAE